MYGTLVAAAGLALTDKAGGGSSSEVLLLQLLLVGGMRLREPVCVCILGVRTRAERRVEGASGRFGMMSSSDVSDVSDTTMRSRATCIPSENWGYGVKWCMVYGGVWSLWVWHKVVYAYEVVYGCMARTRSEQRGEGAGGVTMKASLSDVSGTPMRSGESATSTRARAASSTDAMASRGWAGAGGRASK